MTSYTLSLTVVVVDPRKLALVCRKIGGKRAGSPRVRNAVEMKNNVARGSHGGKCRWRLVYFKNPKTAGTSRQLEM